MRWIEALQKLDANHQGYVLVTVLATKGSIPRDSGSKMLVSEDQAFDSIGGGALEHEVIRLSRQFLADSRQQTQYTREFNLGKDLKQCCGGIVTILFEVFPANDFNIVLFGAGHIGQALIKILEDIDCRVTWFDSRPELFPARTASHIQTMTLQQPEPALESCNANSFFLVMTHNHALDQTLCEAILSLKNSRYCGLIGSQTKALKFRQRLSQKGFDNKSLKKLHCPVGLSSIKSKKPMEIAVFIVAELLSLSMQDSLLLKSEGSD